MFIAYLFGLSAILLCPFIFLTLSPRYERLEDQLNDLTELHQHETTNLKQELASIEEKVAYQAYERARDIQVPHREHMTFMDLYLTPASAFCT